MRTALVFLLVCGATLTGAFLAFGRQHPNAASPRPPAVTAPTAPVSVVSPAAKYLGVAIARDKVTGFTALIGRKPDLYEEHTGFGDRFAAPPKGMLLLVNLESNVPARAILGGYYDAYLRSFAHSVAMYRKPVAISFDPEMNGPWYSYGTRQMSHAEFREIYRHVHNVVMAAGARNVIWTWTIATGRLVASRALLKALYPGDAYVNWVGMDGYFSGNEPTFAQVFVHVFHDVRRFSNRPFLITETSVVRGPHAASMVKELFAGVKSAPDVLGFIWFDYKKGSDWRLEDNPAALTAFRRAARTW